MLEAILQALVIILGTWLVIQGIFRVYERFPYKPERLTDPYIVQLVILSLILVPLALIDLYVVLPTGNHLTHMWLVTGTVSVTLSKRIWIPEVVPVREEEVLLQPKTPLISGRLSHR